MTDYEPLFYPQKEGSERYQYFGTDIYEITSYIDKLPQNERINYLRCFLSCSDPNTNDDFPIDHWKLNPLRQFLQDQLEIQSSFYKRNENGSNKHIVSKSRPSYRGLEYKIRQKLFIWLGSSASLEEFSDKLILYDFIPNTTDRTVFIKSHFATADELKSSPHSDLLIRNIEKTLWRNDSRLIIYTFVRLLEEEFIDTCNMWALINKHFSNKHGEKFTNFSSEYTRMKGKETDWKHKPTDSDVIDEIINAIK